MPLMQQREPTKPASETAHVPALFVAKEVQTSVADLKKALTAAKALTAVSTVYLAEAKQAGNEQVKLVKEAKRLQAAHDPKKQDDYKAVSQTEQNISDVIAYKNLSANKKALEALKTLQEALPKTLKEAVGELQGEENINPQDLAAKIMATVLAANKVQISEKSLINVITKIQQGLQAKAIPKAAENGAPEKRCTVTEDQLNKHYFKEGGRGVDLTNKASIFFTKQVDKVVEYALKGTTMYSGPFKTTVIQLVADALMKMAETRSLNVVSFGRVETGDNWESLMTRAGFDKDTTYENFLNAVTKRRTIILCTNMEALEEIARNEQKSGAQSPKPVTDLLAAISANGKSNPRITMCASTSDLKLISTANGTGMKTYDLDSLSTKEIMRHMDQYHGDHVMHGRRERKKVDGTQQYMPAWFELSESKKKKFVNLVVKATEGHPVRVNMFIEAANEARDLDEVVGKYNTALENKYGEKFDKNLLVKAEDLKGWKFDKRSIKNMGGSGKVATTEQPVSTITIDPQSDIK